MGIISNSSVLDAQNTGVVPPPTPTPAPPSATAASELAAANPLAPSTTDTTNAPAPPPAPGIVAGAMTPTAQVASTPATTTTASIPTDQTAQWNVTPDQTVEGRINSILNANNPIIQQARTRALETMNGRGLLNSSLAMTAADSAAYAAATPIATADAATASKAAAYNTDALNAKVLAQLPIDSQKLLQTNNQAATAFNQAMVSMTNINMNDKMDANAKTQAIAQVQSALQNQLHVLGATSGLNLAQELNFAGYDGFDEHGNYIGFADSSASGSGVAAPAPVAAPQSPYQSSGGAEL